MRRINSFILGLLCGSLIFGTARVLANTDVLARLTTQLFFWNAEKIELEAYNINGYNYVRLRDVSNIFGVNIEYDEEARSVYLGETKAERIIDGTSCAREDYSQKANSNVFNEIYTKGAYDAIRQTIEDTEVVIKNVDENGYNSLYNYAHYVEREVKASVENSYGIDEETGEPYLKTPDEMMDDLGFSSEEKNWANLMYYTLNGQYTDPDGEFADVGGLSDYEGVLLGKERETKVTYYNQFDKRWSSQMYGRSSTIGEAGCGPTSLSIVISTLTGRNVDPPTICSWSVRNGYRCEGNGSYHSLIPAGAEHYGLKVEKLGRSSARELEEHLSSGKLVIAIMSKGHFTSNGHFIVLRGITSAGKVLVADPASYKRSEQEWNMSIILNEARSDAAAGGPFWSISK